MVWCSGGGKPHLPFFPSQGFNSPNHQSKPIKIYLTESLQLAACQNRRKPKATRSPSDRSCRCLPVAQDTPIATAGQDLAHKLWNISRRARHRLQPNNQEPKDQSACLFFTKKEGNKNKSSRQRKTTIVSQPTPLIDLHTKTTTLGESRKRLPLPVAWPKVQTAGVLH